MRSLIQGVIMSITHRNLLSLSLFFFFFFLDSSSISFFFLLLHNKSRCQVYTHIYIYIYISLRLVLFSVYATRLVRALDSFVCPHRGCSDKRFVSGFFFYFVIVIFLCFYFYLFIYCRVGKCVLSYCFVLFCCCSFTSSRLVQDFYALLTRRKYKPTVIVGSVSEKGEEKENVEGVAMREGPKRRNHYVSKHGLYQLRIVILVVFFLSFLGGILSFSSIYSSTTTTKHTDLSNVKPQGPSPPLSERRHDKLEDFGEIVKSRKGEVDKAFRTDRAHQAPSLSEAAPRINITGPSTDTRFMDADFDIDFNFHSDRTCFVCLNEELQGLNMHHPQKHAVDIFTLTQEDVLRSPMASQAAYLAFVSLTPHAIASTGIAVSKVEREQLPSRFRDTVNWQPNDFSGRSISNRRPSTLLRRLLSGNARNVPFRMHLITDLYFPAPHFAAYYDAAGIPPAPTRHLIASRPVSAAPSPRLFFPNASLMWTIFSPLAPPVQHAFCASFHDMISSPEARLHPSPLIIHVPNAHVATFVSRCLYYNPLRMGLAARKFVLVSTSEEEQSRESDGGEGATPCCCQASRGKPSVEEGGPCGSHSWQRLRRRGTSLAAAGSFFFPSSPSHVWEQEQLNDAPLVDPAKAIEFLLQYPHLLHWYGVNGNIAHPKFTALPIGFVFYYRSGEHFYEGAPESQDVREGSRETTESGGKAGIAHSSLATSRREQQQHDEQRNAVYTSKYFLRHLRLFRGMSSQQMGQEESPFNAIELPRRGCLWLSDALYFFRESTSLSSSESPLDPFPSFAWGTVEAIPPTTRYAYVVLPDLIYRARRMGGVFPTPPSLTESVVTFSPWSPLSSRRNAKNGKGHGEVSLTIPPKVLQKFQQKKDQVSYSLSFDTILVPFSTALYQLLRWQHPYGDLSRGRALRVVVPAGSLYRYDCPPSPQHDWHVLVRPPSTTASTATESSPSSSESRTGKGGEMEAGHPHVLLDRWVEHNMGTCVPLRIMDENKDLFVEADVREKDHFYATLSRSAFLYAPLPLLHTVSPTPPNTEEEARYRGFRTPITGFEQSIVWEALTLGVIPILQRPSHYAVLPQQQQRLLQEDALLSLGQKEKDGQRGCYHLFIQIIIIISSIIPYISVLY
eukprot:gene5785-4136_t